MATVTVGRATCAVRSERMITGRPWDTLTMDDEPDLDPGAESRVPVLLTVASSRFECDTITALLRSYGIPVVQGPAAGARPFLDDNSVYVRRADLADARELMEAPVDWPS